MHCPRFAGPPSSARGSGSQEKRKRGIVVRTGLPQTDVTNQSTPSRKAGRGADLDRGSRRKKARLEAATASGKPVLLRVDFAGDHGMGSGRAQRISETANANVWSVFLWQMGGGVPAAVIPVGLRIHTPFVGSSRPAGPRCRPIAMRYEPLRLCRACTGPSGPVRVTTLTHELDDEKPSRCDRANLRTQR